MCQLCGQPDNVRCNCQVTQPFCDQCGNDNACEEKINAECVWFHLNCTNPAGLPNLGINCNTDLDTILHVLDDLVGNHFNITFAGQETATIRWVANGPAGHKPYAHVKISADADNAITEHPDGIYAPVVDAPPAPVFVDETNDCVTIAVTEDEDGIHITPSIDFVCLFNKIRTDFLAEFCELIDQCQCLLPIENLVVAFAAACPEGFILNDLGTLCESTETTAPTLSETVVEACENQYVQYGQYGAIVYNGGYDTSGQGASGHVLNGLTTDIGNGDVTLISTNGVWRNDTGVDVGEYGPVNRAGVWRCEGTGGSLGFIVPINVPTTKTYYLGIAADDEFAVTVNGATIVDTATTDAIYWNDGGARYRYWHIYPVNLTAGINYVGFIGTDTGGVESVLAAEVYDNTLVELQAAALDPAFVSSPGTFPVSSNHYTNLNLIFSTRCAKQPGAVFTLGNATCPDNTWTLDTTGGDPLVPPCQGINSDTADWLCVRTITSPFAGYTATLVWDRIPTAVNYTVQQKANGDPDINYVESTGSPVVNPGSGTTATLVISGLLTDQLTFRVRANFADCSGDWTEIVATGADGCEPVSFVQDTSLPPATNGVPYDYSIDLNGDTPFALTGITKPSWMTIAIAGSTVHITGTPDATGTPSVAFTVTNCTAEHSQAFSGSILVLPADSFSELMRFGDVEETICGQAEVSVYFSGAFAPGTVIYTDPAHTVLKTGFSFVGRTSDALIYNLNPATAVVGALTGNSC